MNFQQTVKHVEVPKFMGTWYVWAGRTTFLERGAHNSIEKYTWNSDEKRIDVEFRYNQGSFDGKLKHIPQKAWIVDDATNAHWKVQPFWPLKFDYLIIDLEGDYQWTVVGVPDGAYLWIMGRTPIVDESQLAQIIERIKKIGYPINDIARVPQQN